MDVNAPLPDRLAGTEGLAKAKPAPHCTLVIFGAGDLTRRLLMPSLYNLQLTQLLDEKFQITVIDRNQNETQSYRDALTESMASFVVHGGAEFEAKTLNREVWNWVRDRITYQVADLEDPAPYEALKAVVQGTCIFYLAVAARFFGPV